MNMVARPPASPQESGRTCVRFLVVRFLVVRFLVRSLLIPPIIILSCAAVFGQQGGTEAAGPDKEKKIGERAYKHVRAALAGAQSLGLLENRVRMQTMAACLLWPRDETHARSIIKEVAGAFASHLTNLDKSDPQSDKAIFSHNRLRFELLWMIAERDSKLALEFLRATRQEPLHPRLTVDSKAQDPELGLELKLAAAIARKDPAEAARIAEGSLTKALSAGAVNVVDRLRQSDVKAASDLAVKIIGRLSAEDLSASPELMNVAAALLKLIRAGDPKLQARNDPDPQVQIDQQSYRDFINIIATAIANLPPNKFASAHLLFDTVQQIMPDVERLSPGLVAAIRQKSARYEQSLDPTTGLSKKYENLMEQGTTDALVEAAAKAPTGVSDEMYGRAAMKSLKENDIERARQIAGSIADPNERASKLKEIERELFFRTARQAKPEDAGAHIPAGASIEERISFLMSLANMAIQKNQKAVARRYLDEALGLVGSRAQNQFQFTSQLQAARAYESVDLNRSFEIIEAVIDRLNDLLDAAGTIDGFGGDWFKDGELKVYESNMWGSLLNRCCDELSFLAARDFDRAMAAAGRLRKPEAHVLGILRVAQRVLWVRDGKVADQARN